MKILKNQRPGLNQIVVFVALLSTICVPPTAQIKKMPKIGYVDAGSRGTTGHRAGAFVRGLQELGYVDDRNIVIEYRWAEGKLERLPELVKEIIHAKVDVIVSSATPAIRSAKEQTSVIPNSHGPE